MIGLNSALAMAAVSLGLVLTPGPNMIYTVSRSIAQGRRAGVISLGGVAVGAAVYMVSTTLGLTAAFQTFPAMYAALKLVGAVYLAWLARQAFMSDGAAVFAPREREEEHESSRRLFAMGLMTNLLNPKIAILYLTLIPQFVDPRGGSPLLQGFAFGGIQIAVSVAANLVIILGAGAVSGFFARRPKWLRVQRYATGVALAALAVTLALT